MVFAKSAPVIHSGTAPSGITVRLSEDGNQVMILNAAGKGATYNRKDIMNKSIPQGTATVKVEGYWPDFAMVEGRPVSKSDQPNMPALLVRVTLGQESDRKPVLELAPAENGTRLAYQIRRTGQITGSGTVSPGESFPLGWADWTAHIRQVLPAAVVATETIPGPPPEPGMHGLPGFRAFLRNAEGKSGPPRWIESGKVTTLTDGKNIVRMAYGLESKPVPFSIRLLDFEIPRDEGTDIPADFRATVEFRDAKTGETKTGLARMNQPASFPGTLWANITGINYKFSQAEWNPRDLNETTLQVLYDPGWLLKWIGSLAICVGIAIMFYWKPGGGTPKNPPQGG